jgi:hypothetical protein
MRKVAQKPHRATGPHPLYEIESIDWQQVRGSEGLGRPTIVAKTLDQVAIQWSGNRPNGYQIGTLKEAKKKFKAVYDVALESGESGEGGP